MRVRTPPSALPRLRSQNVMSTMETYDRTASRYDNDHTVINSRSILTNIMAIIQETFLQDLRMFLNFFINSLKDVFCALPV